MIHTMWMSMCTLLDKHLPYNLISKVYICITYIPKKFIVVYTASEWLHCAVAVCVQVKQGFEPPIFTCHFLGWNPNLWAQDKTYEAYLKEVCVNTIRGGLCIAGIVLVCGSKYTVRANIF